MNWRNLFKSSHTLWLEAQIEELKILPQFELRRVREGHAKEIESLTKLYEDHLAHVESLNLDAKKAHAEELSRVIQDNQKLRDDLDRTRLLLTPALQSVTLKHEQDSSPPPTPSEVEGGTPWMRFRARAIAEQEAAAKPKNYVKPASVPVEGESNGSNGEGRVETSLGK